jgi:DNA-directed RNA polymerase subunit M
LSNPTQKNRKEGIILIDNKAIKFHTRPTVDTDCKKCEGKKAENWILELGSEDKSQSIFFRCIKCGYTWRENG